LRKLQKAYQLSSANIVVQSPPGTDPMTIVSYAQEKSDDYDRVFCVFDRNGHANFDQAVQVVTNSAAGRNRKWVAISSVPCFEIWVLLHFVYAAAPFVAAGGRSACDNVVRELRPHIPGYAKGDPAIYDRLEALTDQAIVHAQRLADHNAATGSLNPATRVHELVAYLRSLR
jgi:hypothetical protein